MALSPPVILLPTNGSDFTTDQPTVTLSGTTVLNTQEIQVNGSGYGVTFTAGETVWSWTGDITQGEANTITIIAIERGTLIPSIPTTIHITLSTASQFITVSPPTGVRLRRYQNRVDLVCSKNPEPQTVGYNFYVSTRSGGVNGTYAPINTVLVTEYSFFEISPKLLNTAVDTAGNIRVTTVTEEINKVYYYSATLDSDRFNALVNAGQLDPVVFNEDTPLFFVASAVIYDSSSGQVTESAFSAELQGSPIVISTGIRDLPNRTQNDIVQTFSSELLSSNKGIDTKPGTVMRDIMDPLTEEMARVYIIQDFLSRSLSVSALQDFDDGNGDGQSDPVSSSVKKTQLQVALNLSNPTDVQRIIDDQFDKLASNVDVTRKGAQAAVGTVLFYIETPPIRDMYVYEGGVVSNVGDLDLGIPSQNYRITTTKVLTYSDRESYYNSQTKRYELSADVVAVTAGSAGNSDSYTIQTANTGVDTDFSVENPNPIAFGYDRESNHDLAGRIQLALFADTGTEGGYVKTAVGVPAVRNVRVEKAGDSLMIRDFDPIRQEHIGGKVDIYIQGSRNVTVTDQIAFEFGSIAAQGQQNGEVFQISNAAAFQFKSVNPRVTAHTPIFDVTRVRNSTRGQDYDISGYQIIGDGNTVDLDEGKPINIAVGIASTDVIRVDYKYRGSDVFVLKHQPVSDIVSVRGQISGTLGTENWELVKLEDPLANGQSTIAKDGLRIKFANDLPLTGFQTIVDEQHVMVVDKNETLNYLGADPESITVRNSDRTVTYAEGIDYRVVPGTDIAPTQVILIEQGTIQNGQLVLISYTAIENFVITYTSNALLEDVQYDVDRMKHACADVIVKQAVENKIDFVFTVIPKTGATNQTFITSKIQTAISNYISQLDVGTPFTQSEAIRLVQGVPDVSSVIVPFNRMVKADGSFIIRDEVGKVQWQVFNTGIVISYITTDVVLSYKTVDNGGPSTLFRGVFEDQNALMLMSDSLDVSGGAGRAFISGEGKLIVSPRDGRLPDDKSYAAAYFVEGETGAKDIDVAATEYLKVGSFSIIYDSPRTQSQVL